MNDPPIAASLDAWWHPLLAGALFYLGAVAAVATRSIPEGVIFLWPANAVLLVALLRSPHRRWPAFVLAVLAARWLADRGSLTTPQSLLFGVINIAEAGLAATLLGRLQGGPFGFERLRQLICFGAVAMGLACGLAAAAGAWVYRHIIGGAESYETYWQVWWLSDGIGLLMLTPALLAWLDRAPWTLHRGGARWELAALLVVAALASVLVFSSGTATLRSSPAGPMLLFPLALWVATRFGLRSVACVGLIVGLIAIIHTRQDLGPFADPVAMHAVLQLQVFLFSLGVSSLAIVTLLAQLRQHNADLRLRQRAIEAIAEGIVIADATQPDLPVTYVNPSFESLTGYSAADVLGRNCRILLAADRDQAALGPLRAALQKGEPARALLRNYRKDGRLFLNDLMLTPVRDEHQRLCAYVGIQRDVTAMHEAQSLLREAHAELTLANQALEQRVIERTRALELLNRKLLDLAHTDSLTGAWNRRYFLDTARRVIGTSQRNGRPLCLLMIDVDRFKAINDQHGHGAGDQALRVLTQTVQTSLRPADVFARFGGEEFIVLLPDTAQAEAINVAERSRIAVAQQQIHHQGTKVAITVSIGVVQWQPTFGLDQWIRQADERLYAAKANGRNQVCA